MPTLNIEGRRVKVDDSFLALSPEEQNKAVDEIAASLGVLPQSSPAPEQMTLEQQRAVALARARRRRQEAGQSSAPAEQRFDGGVPVGGDPAVVPSGAVSIFEVQGPDGRTYEIEAPDMQTAAAAFKRHQGTAQPQEGSGIARNTTAGLNQAIYTVAGAPVDLVRGAMNLGARGINAATGADIGQIPEGSFGGSEFIRQSLGAVSPALDPENTVAASPRERVARGVGEGIGYTLAPEAALFGLGRAGLGAVAPRIADAAGRTFGRSESAGAVARNAIAGGAAGAGATAAMDSAPEDYRALAGLAGGLAGGVGAVGAMGVPAVGRAGMRVVDDFTAPMRTAGRERLAADELRRGATDPAALRSSLEEGAEELVPGSRPTTFQAIGDMGIGALERGAATKRPALFNQRRADQNEARVGAMTGVQRTGAPEAVASAVRQRMQQLDDATQEILDRATGAAGERAGAIGVGMTPEAAGDTMRASLEAARAQVKAQERALWAAVDPDGTLAVQPAGTKQAVARIIEEKPVSAGPLHPAETQAHAYVGQYGEAVPLRELQGLQSYLKSAMRQEQSTSGESPAYRRMTQLNAAVQGDLETAVAGRVAAEEQAVQRGEMRVEDTIEAAVLRQREAWFAERSARAQSESGGAGNVGYGAGGHASVSGVRGASSQARRGPGAATGDPRLSADAANFDEAALGRLTAARDATRQRAETFDNQTLAPIHRRPDMPASAVPQRIFVPGPRGFETVQTFRKAVGDEEAFNALQGYAVDRLRTSAMRPDGTLDPAKVQTWRRTHADPLCAFPELDRRFADAARASESMASVARSRKAALDQGQKGAFGKIVGLDHPDDVTTAVGRLFGAQDSVKQMMRLRQAIASNQEAQQGLRKAVVDHVTKSFVGNTEAGTSGVGTMKSDGFQNFMRRNRSALRAAGFSEDEVNLMGRIAADLQRANRSITSVKIPGQSNTQQDGFQIQKGDDAPTMLAKSLFGLGAAVGGATGGWMGGVAGAYAGQALGAMRMAGIETIDELVADALLNPARAKMLLAKPSRRSEERAWRMLAQLHARSAGASAGVSSNEARAAPGPLRVTIPAGGPKPLFGAAPAPVTGGSSLAEALMSRGPAPLKPPSELERALMGR